MDIIGGPLTELINGLTKAGALRNEIANQGGSERVTGDISKLKGSNFKAQAYQMMLAGYFRDENSARNALLEAQKGGKGGIGIYETRYNAAKTLRQEFQQRGLAVVNPQEVTPQEPPKTGGRSGKTFNPNSIAFNPLDFDESIRTDPDRYFNSPFALADQSALRAYMGFGKKQYDPGRLVGKPSQGSGEEQRQIGQDVGDIASNIGRIFSGLENLGLEIPKELQAVVGGIQVVTGILTAISSIVTIIAAIQGTKAIPVIGWALANGGVIHGANGVVPGNSFSGDNIPALLNSGETVLTRSQSSNLLSALNNGGMGNLQLETVVSGEDLKFVLNNTGRRTGAGEIVTSNMRRI
jgi:hypothetical protein